MAGNRVVIMLVQLALIPILANCWDIETYGRWVMASTIPALLSFADLGFATAAGTSIAMQLEQGDKGGAARTYRNAFGVGNAIALVLSLELAREYRQLQSEPQFAGASASAATPSPVQPRVEFRQPWLTLSVPAENQVHSEENSRPSGALWTCPKRTRERANAPQSTADASPPDSDFGNRAPESPLIRKPTNGRSGTIQRRDSKAILAWYWFRRR